MSIIEENSILFKNIKEKFDVIFENAPDNLIIVSKEGKIISINKKLEKFLGYKENELAGKKFVNAHVISSNSLELAIKSFRQRIVGHKIKPYELEFVRKNGERIFGEVNASLIRENGKIVGSIGFIHDITERKKSEEELKQSEEKYKNIFENVSEGMVYLDKFGTIIDVNKRATEIFRGSKKDLVGKNFLKLNIFKPKQIPMLFKNLKDIITKKEYFLKIEIKNKKGEPAFLECSATYKEGKISVIIRDVTEGKKAEEAIRSAEEKYKNLFENAVDSILILDKKGRFTEINKKVEELLGYTKKDLVGKSFTEANILTAKSKLKAIEAFVKRMTGVNIKPYTLDIIKKNGDILTGEINASAIKQNNEVVGDMVIIRDVTERKKTDQLIRESEEKFRTLFDNVNDGILCADAVTTKFYFGNKAMANMLGYIQEELKNLRIPNIHPKKNLPSILETFKKMSTNQTDVLSNVPVKRKNGSIFYADISSSTITLNNRLYVVGIFRDITERKKTEEELRKARDELQKKVEELERFNRIAIGRELRMIELKKKMNELKK